MSQIGSNLRLYQLHPMRPSHTDLLQSLKWGKSDSTQTHSPDVEVHQPIGLWDCKRRCLQKTRPQYIEIEIQFLFHTSPKLVTFQKVFWELGPKSTPSSLSFTDPSYLYSKGEIVGGIAWQG
jgi:hypothetical protein